MITALIVAGIALRLVPMFWPPALATGDLAMARNITERSFERLLTVPPAWSQTATPGFFALQKGFVSLFGAEPWVLRLLPVCSAIIALLLTARLARTFVGGWGQLVAVALMALGLPFIVFGTHVRPFGGVEVATSLGVLTLGLPLLRGPLGAREALRTGGVIVLLLAVGQMAALAAAALVLTLITKSVARRDFSRLRWTIALAMVWMAVAVAVYFSPSMTLSADAEAATRAVYATGYPPSFPHVGHQLLWVWLAVQRSFGIQQFHYLAPAAFTLAAVAGAWPLWRTHGRTALLLIIPALVAIVAAALGVHPFERYMLLWFTPCLLILVGATVEMAAQRLQKRAVWLAIGWVGLWLADPLRALSEYPPPHRIQEIPTALAYLQSHRVEGDAIYVFAGARQGMAFYGPARGMSGAAYVAGGCHAGQARAYLAELDQFRGRSRVWLLVTWDIGRDAARSTMTQYLRTIGVQRDSLAVTQSTMPPFIGGAWLYLFDLSDPTRLSAATAATLPLPVVPSRAGRDACAAGPMSDDKS